MSTDVLQDIAMKQVTWIGVGATRLTNLPKPRPE
jgi:hypothetical protein